MPGMRGEEEEHPASKSAVLEKRKIVSKLLYRHLSRTFFFFFNSHNKIIAKAINIINT